MQTSCLYHPLEFIQEPLEGSIQATSVHAGLAAEAALLALGMGGEEAQEGHLFVSSYQSRSTVMRSPLAPTASSRYWAF